jgi:tetratricopeptide (TPR) repeat protein
MTLSRTDSSVANPIAKAVRKLKRRHSKPADLGELRQRVAEREWLALEAKGRRILKRAPDWDEVLLLVAFSLQQNRLEEALKFALRALAGAATKAHPYFIAGFALKGMGGQGQACGYLRTAGALDPDNRASLRHLIEAVAASEGVNAAAAEFSAPSVSAPTCRVHRRSGHP